MDLLFSQVVKHGAELGVRPEQDRDSSPFPAQTLTTGRQVEGLAAEGRKGRSFQNIRAPLQTDPWWLRVPGKLLQKAQSTLLCCQVQRHTLPGSSSQITLLPTFLQAPHSWSRRGPRGGKCGAEKVISGPKFASYVQRDLSRRLNICHGRQKALTLG